MILENDIFKNVSNNEIIRIIYIDYNEDVIYYVICLRSCAYPKQFRLMDFKDAINCNMFIKVPDFCARIIDESLIGEEDRKRRDFYWKIINEAWITRKDELLSMKKYRKVYEEIANENKLSYSTVMRKFSQFYEKGMNKNSLLSNYVNSGARGKERNLGCVKTGRPSKYSCSNELSGVNITKEIKNIFQLGIDKFYNNQSNNSLKETYISILKEYFSYKHVTNGQVNYTLFEKNKLPTYEQFTYWYRKNKNETDTIVKRQSQNEFNLNYRPLLSNSTTETIGPGTRFQIDATVADIYLVSKYDRHKIINRPVVYAIIDVFSRMITGIYVGLEGPSWIGAMMALDNMICDKVEYCKNYGIDITEEQWPSKHLPRIILADRGEFEGYYVENLINNLGIVIENTPPYRGDLKGIVERHFNTTNTKIKHKTPGAIMKEYRKRGDKDYRLHATLTLEEFTKIYIKMVINHNNTAIDKYDLTNEMIVDNVYPSPISLWYWGIQNKKGNLRTIDREIMRLNILPNAKASVSRNGIKFKGMFYSTQKAISEQWFINNNVKSVNILYDPRNLNFIYIPDKNGIDYEKCFLLDHCKEYSDEILEEVIFLQELKQEMLNENYKANIQKDIDLDNFINNTVKNAVKEKSNSTGLLNQSNTKKIRSIKKNQLIEKELNRQVEKFELGSNEIKNENIEIVNLNNLSTKDTDAYRKKLIEKIINKGNERVGKQ